MALTAAARAAILDEARWGFPRDEMIMPQFIVRRMAEDIEALFEADEDIQNLEQMRAALLTLGWPKDVIDVHFELSSARASLPIAISLIDRQQVARAGFALLDEIGTPANNNSADCAPPAGVAETWTASAHEPSSNIFHSFLAAALIGMISGAVATVLAGVALEGMK